MKTSDFGLCAAVICILLAGQVSAQTGGAPSQGWQKPSQITGMTVNSPQGEKLGKILVVDQEGTVRYAILSHGGLLGIGHKLIPIPWKALKPGKDKNTLVVNIDKKTLEKAPTFDPKEWPKFSEPDWQKEVEIYYQLPAVHAASR
jgi:PRC-barrel domain